MFVVIYILLFVIEIVGGLFMNTFFSALGNMNLADSAIVGGFAVYGCRTAFALHPALCILVFLGVVAVMTLIQRNIIGFVIVSVLFSLGYAAGAAFLVWDGWHDGIWTGVVGFLIALICLTLHFQHLDRFDEDEPDKLNKL